VARAHLADGGWTGDTFDGLFSRRVAEHPDRLALVDPPNTDELIGRAEERLSWRELDDRVTDLAATLLRLGVRAGDVVAVQLPNCSALVCTFLAVVRIGAIVTPFPMAYREHEMRPMCARTGASVAITGTASTERAVRAGVPTVLCWAGGSPPAGALAYRPGEIGDAQLAEMEQHRARHRAEPNDCVTICWTSGTEAQPKAVPRCHGDWLVIAAATRHSAGLGPDDVLLSPFPMTNMAGISGMFLPWLAGGGVFAPHHPFDLPVFLHQLARERATYTVAPPALLVTLLRNERLLAQVDLSALRLIGTGSAPLSPWVVRAWADRHGVEIINFFGSNEGVGLAGDPADVPDPELRATHFPNYSAAASNWSTPLAGHVAVRLVDAATGTEITEPGGRGELRISGPNVFAGYLGADLTAPLDRSAFDDRGYFRSGDIFELAGEDGRYLRYVDRLKDLVIRGGMNIAPAELEGLLVEHPLVGEVAVIGLPDEVLGERVCAVVVPAPGGEPTLEELVAWLRDQHLASYKLPERLALVDTLPRNPLGKVLKRDLRSRLICDPA
jgi:acyl-CoA synthetase (AMP-forming)/AMP-acid ligase II